MRSGRAKKAATCWRLRDLALHGLICGNGYTRVVAPFDGVVTNHQVDLGALVGMAGPTALATIVQLDPLYVYFTASEPQILTIRRDLAKRGESLRTTDLSDIPVEIGLQDEEGYPHKGHMDYVAPQFDTSTGTLTGRALFDNKDHALSPGMFVRVRIPIAQPRLMVAVSTLA
jgi:membrane fusion protein, multidrug efflux system